MSLEAVECESFVPCEGRLTRGASVRGRGEVSVSSTITSASWSWVKMVTLREFSIKKMCMPNREGSPTAMGGRKRWENRSGEEGVRCCIHQPIGGLQILVVAAEIKVVIVNGLGRRGGGDGGERRKAAAENGDMGVVDRRCVSTPRPFRQEGGSGRVGRGRTCCDRGGWRLRAPHGIDRAAAPSAAAVVWTPAVHCTERDVRATELCCSASLPRPAGARGPKAVHHIADDGEEECASHDSDAGDRARAERGGGSSDGRLAVADKLEERGARRRCCRRGRKSVGRLSPALDGAARGRRSQRCGGECCGRQSNRRR